MLKFLNKNSRNLEERLFINVLFVSLISVLLFTTIAVIILRDPPVIIADGLASIIVGVILYLVSFKRMYRQMVLPFVIAILLAVNSVWFISGGYDSPNGYILIGILIIGVIVSRHRHSKRIIFALVTNVIVLFTIEYHYPEIVNEYDKKDDIVGQGAVLVSALIIINYIIFQLKKSYDDERQKVIEINEDLEHKNYEIETQNDIITSQNKRLKSYSDELEKKVEERTYQLSNLNNDLTKQNLTLEQFTFITAHNLRAPIAQIKGLVSLLPDELLENDLSKETLVRLKESVMKLDEVVNDLTKILNIKKGGEKLEPIRLNDQLNLALSTLKNNIKEKEAQIHFTGDPNIRITGTRAYIQSIFYNLIHNALKYSSKDRKPCIYIDFIENKSKVEIIFKDNGIGFDMKYAKDKIFQLYQRFNSDYQGKGFGLFLTKTQVEAMRGEIAVESTQDVGTRFILKFPRVHLESFVDNPEAQ